MKLVHFSPKPIKQLLSIKQSTDNLDLMKPRGFWVSDEDDHGWSVWCKSEEFRELKKYYAYEITLDTTGILFLRTAADIDGFSKKYQADSEMNKFGRETVKQYFERDSPRIYEIAWEAVAKEYQGIIITPYCWEERLGSNIWYNGWDCASGCIWDATAIAKIKLLTSPKQQIKMK